MAKKNAGFLLAMIPRRERPGQPRFLFRGKVDWPEPLSGQKLRKKRAMKVMAMPTEETM